MKEVYGASISRTAEIEALISKPQP